MACTSDSPGVDRGQHGISQWGIFYAETSGCLETVHLPANVRSFLPRGALMRLGFTSIPARAVLV